MILAERYLYPRWLAHDRLGSRAAHRPYRALQAGLVMAAGNRGRDSQEHRGVQWPMFHPHLPREFRQDRLRSHRGYETDPQGLRREPADHQVIEAVRALMLGTPLGNHGWLAVRDPGGRRAGGLLAVPSPHLQIAGSRKPNFVATPRSRRMTQCGKIVAWEGRARGAGCWRAWPPLSWQRHWPAP